MSNLLARYAELIFWTARYIERAENLARILDVNESFSGDASGAQNWESVLALNSDLEAYQERHGEITAEQVIRFYTLDMQNPNSIVSSLRMARENARTLRPFISSEMWVQMNIFYNDLLMRDASELTEARLNRFCDLVRVGCQSLVGIAEGTFYRDEGWYFYQIGKYVERADQSTRLLDVKYHLLLPSTSDVGSPLDVAQWAALLRSAGGYYAFRRVRPRGLKPANVAEFLLFNQDFPRSVRACVQEVDQYLDILADRFGVSPGGEAGKKLDALRAELESREIQSVINAGLHEFIDWIQAELIGLTNAFAMSLFGHQYDPPAEEEPLEQNQSQG